MPKSKIIITLGALIALLPVLGFPHRWEAFFQIAAGLSIMGLSVWSTIDKKLTLKAKAQRRQAARKQVVQPEPKDEKPIEEEWSEITELEKGTEL